MSLLKVNNPRSLLINAENGDSLKNVVTIKTNKNENRKVVIVKPPDPPTPPEQKLVKIVSKNKEDERINVIKEPSSFQIDDDLQMPSEIFDCNFLEEKDEVKEIPGEFYFETDHEALRGNPDYHKLLKIYAVLQAKKIQVSYR